MRFRIGVMVLASLLVTGILLIMFGETRNLFQPVYTLNVIFPQAPGVSEGTPIRRSGVVIGKVQSVEPLDEGGVLVTAEIQKRMKLRKGDVCRISANLLGDSVLNFVPPQDPRASKELVEDGETLHGVVSPDPVAVVADMQQQFSGAIGSVSKTSEDFDVVIRKVGTLLEANEQRINSVVLKADNTLTTINETARHANDMVGDPASKQQLKDSLEQLPQVLREMRETLVKFNQAATRMDRNLQNIEGFTKPLGDRGPVVIDELNRGVEKLDDVMTQMLTFTQSLNNQQGTLGQLIHSRELYDNLNRAVVNIEDLTQQMQPILRDARVFSDKIARHPETLGVRGMVDRNPGTKGVPSFAPLR